MDIAPRSNLILLLAFALPACIGLPSTGPIVGELTASDAELILLGPAASVSFGRDVTTGDFDGDGVADLAVLGAETIHVFSGPLTRELSSDDAVAVIAIGASGSVLATGDLDGDGTDDLVVGSPNEDQDRVISGGVARVFPGPLLGTLATTDARSTVPGTHGYERLGGHVSVGDFDGDGAADLAVTAGGLPRGDCFGALLVFRGPLAEGRTGVPRADASLDCVFGMDTFPDAGGFVGDLDDDGAVELAAASGGSVFVASGGFAGPMEAQDAGAVLQDQAGRGLFGAVLSAADVDRDGLGDLLVATLDDDGLGDATGAVDVITRSVEGRLDLPDAAAATFLGALNGTRAGWALDASGDLDGDGFVEIVVTAPGPTSSGEVRGDGGHAWIFYGPLESAGFDEADATITGEAEADGLGTSARIVPDLNGDGYADLVVGAPGTGGRGAVYVFLGGAR